MIGLELGISVASCALRHEPTGTPTGFRSDVVATAKTVLKAGSMLDGEGGFCVWGKQTPADVSLDRGLLPLGLAHNVKLRNDIAEGQALKWSDVVYDANDTAVKARREMEAAWEEIQKHPQVRCTIDLFFIGLVFFKKEFSERQHFKIKF